MASASDDKYSPMLCRCPVRAPRRFQSRQRNDAGQEVVAAQKELPIVAPQRQVTGGLTRGDMGSQHSAPGVDDVAVVNWHDIKLIRELHEGT
jgi:hypothetical protein